MEIVNPDKEKFYEDVLQIARRIYDKPDALSLEEIIDKPDASVGDVQAISMVSQAMTLLCRTFCLDNHINIERMWAYPSPGKRWYTDISVRIRERPLMTMRFNTDIMLQRLVIYDEPVNMVPVFLKKDITKEVLLQKANIDEVVFSENSMQPNVIDMSFEASGCL